MTFRRFLFCYLCGMNLNRQILSLALPAIVSNVTVPLLGLSDTAIGSLGLSSVYSCNLCRFAYDEPDDRSACFS